MPRITIDGKTIDCRPDIPVLQAALEGGFEIPHYCYHPGLSIVASCRLCLMEMKMPHPRTHELTWAPKLFPSCQTPVKDGMEVRFNSEAVQSNQAHVMEYYLLNHPLDCPVCDKAGECWLQDYSEEFGYGSSRMIDEKLKNPKKDIGPHTLLYQDRCVLCSRCVRFCQEIAGPGELTVVNRGARCEIDVMPGVPLENPLQGNVVDLCPVGALLNKEFLFKQRVWLLRSTKSVSPVDSQGQTIWIDWNEQGLHRIRPRYNEKVNTWWISDEARFDWKYVRSAERLTAPAVRSANPSRDSNQSRERKRAETAENVPAGGNGLQPARWEGLPALLRDRFASAAATENGARVAVVLSPFMSCEEAWLLAQFIRGIAPQATLALGYVPVIGEDFRFPKGFVIKAEKCPNRRGVETVIRHFSGPGVSTAVAGQPAGVMDFRTVCGLAAEGRFAAAYVVGGHPPGWVNADVARAFAKIEFLVVQDIFRNALDEFAAVRIPSCAWAEREGTFMNDAGLLQPFDRALPPLEGTKSDGQFLYELTGGSGLFMAQQVREQMAAEMPEFRGVFEPQPLPKHAH